MRFISYARNFEDILLWRALHGVAGGFYVDVGAGGPSDDSVTRALYERGWRGINLEPARAQYQALRIARPADINLQTLAGAAAATVTFYDIEGARHSGIDEVAARAAQAGGTEVVQRQLTQQRLDAVLEAHAGGPIHLLKIDTGGTEAAVLDGLDLARWRPWIVLLAGAGDARLARAGYRAAYSDASNVFYVADEHAGLAAALALPPGAGDDFYLRPDHPYAYPLDEWRALAAQLRAEAAQEQARADEARAWAEARVQEREVLFGQREAVFGEREAVFVQREAVFEARTTELQRELDASQAHGRAEHARALHAEQQLATRIAEADAAMQAILNSSSWRYTARLRAASLRLQHLRARLRDLSWQIRHRIAMLRQGARGAARGVAKRAVRAVMARPRLFFFLRHHIGRHPRLVGWLRVLVHRSQAPAPAAPAHGGQPDGLSAPARHVLADLRRATDPTRPR